MRDARLRPIALAYVTTGFSKIATAAVQLLALPVVAVSLGTERFGAMLVLASFASLLAIPAQGLSPSASFGLSQALGQDRPVQVRQEYWSVATLALLIGAIMPGIAVIAYWWVDPAQLTGRDSAVVAPELKLAFAAIAAHLALFCFSSFIEGARAAYQENHVTNLFAMAASITTLALVGLCWKFVPVIGAFYFAIFTVPPLFQTTNLLLFHRKRRKEFGTPAISKQTLLQNFRRSIDCGAAQTGISLYLHGAVYLAAQYIGLSAGAVIGGMIRLFILTQSTFNSFLTPILPTISRGTAAGDLIWVRKALRTTAICAGTAAVGFAMTIALAGDFVLNLWLQLDAPDGYALFPGLALMSFCYMITNMQNLALLALGDGTWGARRILAAGGIGFALGCLAMRLGGLSPFVAVQGATMLVIAVIPLAVRLARHGRSLP